MGVRLLVMVLLFISSNVFAMGKRRAAPASPPECSISVGITNRLGVFRTWTNALEKIPLENEKGFHVCDDEVGATRVMNRRARRDEKTSRKDYGCRTEFKLTMRFEPDYLTRTVKIYRGEALLYKESFGPNPPEHSLPSQKILKSIPTCQDLKKLATQVGK